jgi:hypothetical protein
LNQFKEKLLSSNNNGKINTKKAPICTVNRVLEYGLKEQTRRAIKAKSDSNNRNLIKGSAVNNPVTNKDPNGKKIIEPGKKIKRYEIMAIDRIVSYSTMCIAHNEQGFMQVGT